MKGLVHPDTDICQAMSSRLSTMDDLRLPASLLREQPHPEAAAVKQHLLDLLQRDAAVFLERYGPLLQPDELQSFEPLRDHYEVNFYLDQAKQQQQQEQEHEQQGNQPPPLSNTAKNRRLAFMRRLEQEGDYFSEQAMRERQPLVWQECIGRYEGHPGPPTAPTPGEHGFAGSLLASYDEALLRERLQQEMEDEEAAMSEHDSDDDSQDELMHPADTQQGQPPQRDQPAPQAAGAPTSITSTPAGGRAAAGAAAAAAAASRADQASAQQQQQQQQQQQPAAAAVDMGPEAMSRRRQEFLQEMQSRFLLGLDGEQHSYAAIDADTSLDDDWAKEQAQDAEDAYFDAD